MLGCNQDITVWNRKKVPELSSGLANSKNEIFVRQVLPVKCKWKNYTQRSINDGTANIYNSVVIIIPYFDGISDLHIKEGDIAALGIYEIDITGVSPYTASEVKRLLVPNITTINSVAYNFDLSDNIKGRHLRLTGN